MIVTESDARRARLRDMIADKSILRGHFKLAAGGNSDIFFDMKQTLLLPEGLTLVGSLMLEMILGSEATAVGGLELGACPIVGAIAQASYGGPREIAAFYVRKQPKKTGTKEHIEGYRVGDHKAVYMVEDVSTTGSSVIKSVEAVKRETDCTVAGVLTVVDRQQGAVEALANIGLRLTALFSKDDFA